MRLKSSQGTAKMAASLGPTGAEVQGPKGRGGGMGFIKSRVAISFCVDTLLHLLLPQIHAGAWQILSLSRKRLLA